MMLLKQQLVKTTEFKHYYTFSAIASYSQSKTYEMIKDSSADKILSWTQVFEWHRSVQESLLSLEDDKERGCKSSIDAIFVPALKNIDDSDRCVTNWDICHITGFKFGTVQPIINRIFEH